MAGPVALMTRLIDDKGWLLGPDVLLVGVGGLSGVCCVCCLLPQVWTMAAFCGMLTMEV